MKRSLWLMCLCCASALALAACGDDDSGGETSEDGGVSFTDLNEVNGRIDGVDDAVNEVAMDLDDLAGNVADLSGEVGGLGTDLDDLDTRVADLENPDLVSCSEEEQCIPDGISLVEMGVEGIVARLCELEIECCSADELNYKFGPGITTVAECTATFVDLINNGLSPDFLEENGWLIGYVIEIAQALNDTRVREELDDEAIAACLAYLEDRECPQYAEQGEAPIAGYCETSELPEGNPCNPWLMVNGLQEAGELCGLSNLPECADGTVCRQNIGPNGEGLCAVLAEEGDRCTDDYQCDPVESELFCNKSTGECQERADAGEDCGYVDPSFTITTSGNLLYPGFDENLRVVVDETPYYRYQNANAMTIECKRGHVCDPVLHECVPICSDGSLCYLYTGNTQCPQDHTCNFTETPALYQSWGFGACRPALALDAPCTLGSECASGRCQNNGEANVCFAALKAVGDACTVGVAGIGQLDAACETGFCAATSPTSTTGACAERCNLQSECPSTHFCNTALTQIDLTHGDDGWPCDLKRANTVACSGFIDSVEDPAAAWNNYQCASGFCNAAAGAAPACADKVAADGACSLNQDAHCPNTQYCNVSACANFLATDAVCAADTDCGPGNQCWDSGANFVCRPLGAAGADCSAGRLCNSFDDIICTTIAAASQCQPAGAFPTGANCNINWTDDAGVSHYRDTQCASTWCRANDLTCADPIAAGGDCDISDPALNRCVDGTYCRYALDEPGTAGECTAQVTVGQACNPRYSNMLCPTATNAAQLCANNCLMNAPCELQNDAFVCSWLAVPEETLFCDGG